MTLDELKGLRQGEVVVITKVDEKITEYHNYQVGDEVLFMEFDSHNGDVVNFLRTGDVPVISHFSYEICHYIERKIKLERDKKLSNLGI
jgi:hypothetical protein